MDKVRNKGIYADLCRIHLQNVEFAHGTQYFLPWHREIINRLEEALRAEDDSVTLPYWDWSVESQFPEDSIVFTNKYFGGNGGGGCIGGRYSNSGMGCVLRNFDQGRSIGAFAAPEVIRNVLRAGSFSEFWNRIEASPHGNVHNNIGGDMATMSSCKDPFFYLHHAYIDKLWAIWQR
ncbi:Di-copper centre-containing protein, partial [Conidiobolus coronatus NRRL 28638]